MMAVCLILAGIGFGVWIGQRDARKKRGRWQQYPQTYDIMKDCK